MLYNSHIDLPVFSYFFVSWKRTCLRTNRMPQRSDSLSSQKRAQRTFGSPFGSYFIFDTRSATRSLLVVYMNPVPAVERRRAIMTLTMKCQCLASAAAIRHPHLALDFAAIAGPLSSVVVLACEEQG